MKRTPLTKSLNDNTLLTLYVLESVVQIAFKIKKQFDEISPRLNNFEERIKKLEKRHLDAPEELR